MAITPQMLQQLMAQYQGQGLGDPTGILPASGIPQPVPLSGLPLGASGLGFPGETLLAGLGRGMGGGPMGQIPSPEFGGPAPMLGAIGGGALGQGGYGGFGGGFQQGPLTGPQEVPGAAATSSGDVLGLLQQGIGGAEKLKSVYDLYQKLFGVSADGPFWGGTSPEAQQALASYRQGERGDFSQFLGGGGISPMVAGGFSAAPPTLDGTSAATGYAPFTPEYVSQLLGGAGGLGASDVGLAAEAGMGLAGPSAAGAGAAETGATAGAFGTGAGAGMSAGLAAAAAPFLISDIATALFGGPSVYEIFTQTGGKSQAQKQAEEAQALGQGASSIAGGFDQATTLADIAKLLQARESGYVGGTESPALRASLPRELFPAGGITPQYQPYDAGTLRRVAAGEQPYNPAEHPFLAALTAPGVPSSAPSPYTGPIGIGQPNPWYEVAADPLAWLRLAQANPQALSVSLQGAPNPRLLDMAATNEALKQSLLTAIARMGQGVPPPAVGGSQGQSLLPFGADIAGWPPAEPTPTVPVPGSPEWWALVNNTPQGA